MKRLSLIHGYFPRLHHARLGQGFILIEVMISLVIIAVGLLGIAGLNAYAINSTAVARSRGIAAMHAANFAAAMGANAGTAGYWASGIPVGFTATVVGTTISNAALSAANTACTATAATSCTANACTPVKMAACDMQQWGDRIQNDLPGGTGAVTCTGVAPNLCTISVLWSEKVVMVKSSSAANAAPATSPQTYQIIVQP